MARSSRKTSTHAALLRSLARLKPHAGIDNWLARTPPVAPRPGPPPIEEQRPLFEVSDGPSLTDWQAQLHAERGLPMPTKKQKGSR